MSEELEQIVEEENQTIQEKQTEEKQVPFSKKLLRGLGELLIYAVIAVVCLFVIPKFVVQRTVVSGDSMETTLHSGDNILVEKMSYYFHEPRRFDVVVFYHYFQNDVTEQKKADAENKEDYDFYVKRIIGLPGETVQIIGTTIYINGVALEENYGKDPIAYQGIASEPIVLAKDEYFVLGDNREVSFDSRYEAVGPIHRDLLVGKAWVRIWPMSQFGFFDKE